MLIAAKNAKTIKDIEVKLQKQFNVKTTRETNKFEGFVVKKLSTNTVKLCQTSYCDKLANMCKVHKMKKTEVTVRITQELLSTGTEFEDKKKFQASLGSILYINVISRPDISLWLTP